MRYHAVYTEECYFLVFWGEHMPNKERFIIENEAKTSRDAARLRKTVGFTQGAHIFTKNTNFLYHQAYGGYIEISVRTIRREIDLSSILRASDHRSIPISQNQFWSDFLDKISK